MFTILGLVLATATTTLTLARARIFKPFRDWVSGRSEFWGDLVNCTYCTSHWVAFFYAAIGARRVADHLGMSNVLLVWLVLSMSLVALSAPVQWLVFNAHKWMEREEE